ncbi:hemolysin family protein [bacterium]|nr:hemolysin family protein [bacterium]
MDIVIILILVGFSALFSGLTLGFFSLNKDDLERKMKLGDEQAKKIYRVRKNGNLLLCTLLIGNVAINSALSIFLGSIVSGFLAGITATGLIVIFGEIIPQATFSRYAFELGVKVVWIVRIFIFALYPICWPLAWLLDKILGDEMPSVYSRKELIKIIEEHEQSGDSKLDEDEEKIIKGALSFSDKIVNDILTPRVEIFSLPINRLLDKKTIKDIKESGHSRIPIYREKLDDIAGILYAKDLIGNNFKDKTAEEVMRDNVIYVDYNKKLDDLLNAFKANRQHLFIVINEYGELSGLVSIEDVLEEIIGAEIMDEDDKFADLQAEARKKMKKKKLNKV